MVKLTKEDAKKMGTRHSAEVIVGLMREFSPHDLLAELFVKTSDPIAWHLVKQYEKQLVLACVNPPRFKEGLQDFFKETANYIRENRLYKKFFEFAHFIYEKLADKEKTVFNAYLDLLLEQATYFYSWKIIWGVSSEGNPLIRDEIYPYLDFPFLELLKKYRSLQGVSWQMMQRTLRKYGYEVENMDKFMELTFNEQIWNNHTFHMAHLIDETCKDFFPHPPLFLSLPIRNTPGKWKPTEVYKKELKTRRYMLPSDGVIATFKQAGCVEEIYFKERLYTDRIILLWRIKIDGAYTTGYFDTKTQSMYTPWKHCNHNRQHYDFENFILEAYMRLTTDAEVDVRKAFAMKVVDDLTNFSCTRFQPVVAFSIPRPSLKSTEGSEGLRIFDKTKYEAAWRSMAST